ncbi:hypothetical protein [Oceanobacillus kimchii]|uniref:hypothetical protein n=1 Tax=Oceanobacillus kimchii TaxID=746691 RepID=UPI00034BC56B|nr:hypothetical protein [Oceanobacillus kimchii]
MSKRLIDVGYLRVGMVLQDVNGNKGTITELGWLGEMPLVHINDSPNPVMWNWNTLSPDVMVLEGME